jgi:hypothetical protein
MSGSRQTNGLQVDGTGTKVTARGCKMEGNNMIGIDVSDGAVVEVSGCHVDAATATFGVLISGSGSLLRADG